MKRVFNIDKLVKSWEKRFAVIPVKTGIQTTLQFPPFQGGELKGGYPPEPVIECLYRGGMTIFMSPSILG